MDRTKFLKMLEAYELDCENGKVKAYKDGEVNSHIHWRGRLSAAKDFRQMMLDGAFDIETNEQPSNEVTAAVEGLILTEEELKLKERAFSTGVMPKWEFDQVIYSHRNLLSANAELSFKNNRFKESLEKVKSFTTPEYDHYFTKADVLWAINKALEELK